MVFLENSAFVQSLLMLVAGILCLYVILIVLFCIGWNRIYAFVPKGSERTSSPVSIVVPCHNEARNIRSLIACLAQQSNQNFELIIVDDHSTDKTRKYIEMAQQYYDKIVLIDAQGRGKKNALREGILASKNELILTTDADCLPSYHWVESICTFQQKNRADLIICPVRLMGRENMFSYLQVLEFTSLVASAAGAAGVGMPVLCNGANLAFRRSVWLKSQKDLKMDEQSGDDIFFLESVKKQKGKIRFLKSESAFVTTSQVDTVWQLLGQRRRWSAKSRFYTDWQLIATSMIVFSVNVSILTLLALAPFNKLILMGLAGAFLLKYLVDSIFLGLVRQFFQLSNIWLYSFFLSLLYPFYIVFVALSSLLYRPRKWN